MDIAAIENGLRFRDLVYAVRQKYYVFEGDDLFLVLTYAEYKRGGNYNIVSRSAVEYVHSRFTGQRSVTAKDVTETAKRTKHAPNALAALNVLYILVSVGSAKIEKQGAHQQLFFRILKKNP